MVRTSGPLFSAQIIRFTSRFHSLLHLSTNAPAITSRAQLRLQVIIRTQVAEARGSTLVTPLLCGPRTEGMIDEAYGQHLVPHPDIIDLRTLSVSLVSSPSATYIKILCNGSYDQNNQRCRPRSRRKSTRSLSTPNPIRRKQITHGIFLLLTSTCFQRYDQYGV